MAKATPSVACNLRQIATAFVNDYYNLLRSFPDQLYRFYQDSSLMSYLEPNGTLTSVTTLERIKEKIQSKGGRNYYWAVQSAIVQRVEESTINGVFIVVKGCVTDPDRICGRFTQSFFLVPQENNDYIVHNDILCVIKANQPVHVKPSEEEYPSLIILDHGLEGKPIQEAPVTKLNPVDERKTEKQDTKLVKNEEMPSTSYTTLGTNTTILKSSSSSEVQGYAVYVMNMPLDTTLEKLVEKYNKYGIIKACGMQIRKHMNGRHFSCFVEFETLEAMQDAIMDYPINMDGKDVYCVEKKKEATPSVASSLREIATALVNDYYRLLRSSPDQVYRFYRDSSHMSRLEPNGTLTYVTSLQYIKEGIQSKSGGNYYWVVQTAIVQRVGGTTLSGVFIVAKGCVTGPDRICRRFTQSFFLIPQQNNGFFVLNDIVCVIDGYQLVDVKQSDPSLVIFDHGLAGKPVHVENKKEKQDTKLVQNQEMPSTNNTTIGTNYSVSKKNSSCEVQGYSVYVMYLPLDTTLEKLDEKYSKYGTIKACGIQFRKHRNDRYFSCLVQFKTLEAMQAAIRDSPINMDGKHVYCKEKKEGTSSITLVNGAPTCRKNE